MSQSHPLQYAVLLNAAASSLLLNCTQLSLISLPVAQSNKTISQSVEDDGQATSQLPPPVHHQNVSSSTYTGTCHTCGVHVDCILLGFTFVAIM